MTPSADSLVARLPCSLYHLTYAANWPSIQRYGLLSTAALLELAEVGGEEQERILSTQRTEQVRLPNGVLLRDQCPMPQTALSRCLHNMTPDGWYALVNTKVFFWLDSERLRRIARAGKSQPQIILSIDTRRLVARYADRIALTPINTGNARRQPAKRGQQTFVSYAQWSKTAWASEAEALGTRERSRSHRPVELTVSHSIPDIMDFVTSVRRPEPEELLADDELTWADSLTIGLDTHN